MKKRMLALLMTIVMSLSLLPMSALAAGETSGDQIPEETCTVDYTKKQSSGVTYTGYTGNQDDGYVFTYTIEEDAPSDIVIDLAQCALSWWENETQMPGGKYKFSIQIVNNSGRVYEYKDNSFVLAPGNTANLGSLDKGSLLPVLTYDGQYLPIKFSGAMLPQCFEGLYDETNPYNAESFKQLCSIYGTLKEKGYTSISDYLLKKYFSEKFNYGENAYASLSAMVADNPKRLETMFSTTGHNGIYRMSESELNGYIEDYPWIDPFCYVTKVKGTDDLNVQIKWPEGDIAAISYNSFYQSIFSVVYGKEYAKQLNPNGDGVNFSRAHAVGDYMPGTDLYRETNAYFQGLTKKGLKTGETMTIDAAWGLDGPGMGNSYQNYSFTYHNMIELKEKEPETWDVSKSKEATNLDSKYESTVTLSLPAAEDELVTDVVFVFDESSCNELGAVQEEVLSMLKELYRQFSETDAKIKVGAVQFRGNVTELPLTELNDESIESIQTFMKTRPTVGGSNMSAGLLAGEKMLDSDTSVSADRKYLILVSDGITYIWDDEATEKQENYGVNFANLDTPNSPMLAGPDGWDVKYGVNQYYVPVDWSEHLKNVSNLLDKTIDEKASLYERVENATTGKPFIAGTEKDQYASTVDIALYKSYQVFQSISAKYHTYVRNVGVKSEMDTFPFGPSFMTYLAGGKDLTFEDIQKEIYYVVSTGSYVVDTMGYGNDGEGNWYEFDFVDDIDTLELNVGGEALNKVKLSEDDELTVYGFGAISLLENARANNKNYQFVLEYHHEKDDEYEDYFILHINTDITITYPVQLTYKVVLTNPQTSAGTYGTYDKDGSEKLNDLWTNRSATLYPVDSEGNPGTAEDFLKPTVSYTVSSSSGGGGSTKPPVLNTEDHYGYIIGYPVDYYTGEKTNDQTRMPVKPEGNITRAEVATIFFRMLTDESRNEFWSQTSSYSDVEADDWFNNAICTLSNAGIINGYNDGTFKPNGKITRAEFATIASRFFEYADENIENPFSDVEEGAWYYKYIMAASEMGLINGYPDGTFGPEKLITRAEAVTIVNRTLDRHPDQDHFLKDMLVWPDNMDTEKWYYADMQEATNSHEYQMKTKNGEKYEVWTKMLPIRDWAAFEKEWSDANSASGGEVVK